MFDQIILIFNTKSSKHKVYSILLEQKSESLLHFFFSKKKWDEHHDHKDKAFKTMLINH